MFDSNKVMDFCNGSVKFTKQAPEFRDAGTVKQKNKQKEIR